MAIVGVLAAAVFVHVMRAAVRLRRQGDTRSRRLEGLRTGVAAVFVLGAVLTVLLPSEFELKDDLVLIVVYGGMVTYGALSLALLRTRRVEQSRHRIHLVEQGLPVRPRLLSWKVVAIACVAAGPVVIVGVAPAIAASLALVAGRVTQPAVEAVTMVAVVGWVVVSAYLIGRQIQRRRVADRRYWMAYRAAAGVSRTPDGGPDVSPVESRASPTGADT